MVLPGAIALLAPIVVGFGFKGVFPETSSAEMLGGLLAGITVSGVLMGIFQNNAGGAWDNAKKSFEKGVLIDGTMQYKGSDAHKASVTGDTVGDPFKDTSGPSMNILIKLTSIVALVIAPHISVEPALMEKAMETNTAPEVKAKSMTMAPVSGGFGLSNEDVTIQWVAKKVTGQHEGELTGAGEIEIDNNIVVRADIVASMKTLVILDIKDAEENGKLRGHLMSDDFFSAEKYETAEFSIIRSGKNKENYYDFEGALTIKGITKSIIGKYRFREDKEGKYLVGAFDFDRTDFDIKYGSGKFFEDLGDKMIYDKVNMGFQLKIG